MKVPNRSRLLTQDDPPFCEQIARNDRLRASPGARKASEPLTLAYGRLAPDGVSLLRCGRGRSISPASRYLEPGVHVPAILRGPNLPKGQRVSALAQTYDLYPTLCELVGVTVPDTVESRSLLALLSDTPETGRETVHAMFRDVRRMASNGRYKLIRYYCSARAEATVGTNRVQLFDLATDPLEMRDRSHEPELQGTLDALQADLYEWQQAVGDPLLLKSARLRGVRHDIRR